MPTERYILDELDEELLHQLVVDARLPVATLAKRLDVARSTVQARLDRLERQGVITGYTVRLGAATRAAQIRATALLTIEPRATNTVLQRLKAMPEVSRAHTTGGRFDLIVEMAAATTADLDTLLDRIGAIPGVKGSESLIHLSTRIDRGT